MVKRWWAFCLLAVLVGCTDPKSLGMGRWPEIPEPAPLILNAEETAAINKFAVENPTLAAKIKKQSDTYLKLIQVYNEEAKKVNRTQLKALGYTDEEMPERLREKPNK